MRLNKEYIKAIKEVIQSRFSDAKIYLFGSRVDDTKKGGDIDLYIETTSDEYDYLKVLGLIALAYSWLKVLDVSYKELSKNKKFFEDKIETANFFFNRVLPRIDSHYKSATSGSKYIMDFKFN